MHTESLAICQLHCSYWDQWWDSVNFWIYMTNKLRYSVFTYLSAFRGSSLPCDFNSLVTLKRVVNYQFIHLFFMLWERDWQFPTSLKYELETRSSSNIIYKNPVSNSSQIVSLSIRFVNQSYLLCHHFFSIKMHVSFHPFPKR